jgi:IPT/TIG domain
VFRQTLSQTPARFAAAALAAAALSCSSPTNPRPVVTAPAIHSVSPSAGPATGGTEVMIRGTGFAAGATISIGGRPATDVTVRGADAIAAKTPASAIAGPVDVVVSLDGRTNSLVGGFRYEPTAPNTAPVIGSMTAQGKRVRQPPAFADYGETIQIAVAVQDAESTPAQLVYHWRPCDGRLAGTGPQVEWTAPTGGTLPSTCTIEVTITDGPHVAVRSVVVRLHNSVEEVRSLVLEFLTEFANSMIPAETTVRNFSSSCPGKAAELKDVMNNRATRTINAANYGVPAVTVAFGSACRSTTADACARTTVEWQSTVKATNLPETAKGTSVISGVYSGSRWWLCESSFDGASSLNLHFMD